MLVIILTFTAVFGSVIGLCTRLVAGFRLPDAKQREPEALNITQNSGGRASAFAAEQASGDNRVARIASMVGQGQETQGGGNDRRDARLAAAVMGAGGASVGGATTTTNTTTLDRRTDVSSGGVSSGNRTQSDSSARLGQTGRRRSNPTRSGRNKDSQSGSLATSKLISANGNPR